VWQEQLRHVKPCKQSGSLFGFSDTRQASQK